MCPIFLNTEVPITPDIIGDHMMDYVRQHKLSEKPRKLLLSGMRAEKVLLASPLVKWYLDHGLEITRVSDEKTFLRHITSYRLFSILNIEYIFRFTPLLNMPNRPVSSHLQSK